MEENFYKTLRIRRTATSAEVRVAYLHLARVHHPDLNQSDSDAGDKFRQIQLAYDVLSDSLRREDYDRDPQSFKTSSDVCASPYYKDGKSPFTSTSAGSARASYNDLPRPRSAYRFVAFCLVAVGLTTIALLGRLRRSEVLLSPPLQPSPVTVTPRPDAHVPIASSEASSAHETPTQTTPEGIASSTAADEYGQVAAKTDPYDGLAPFAGPATEFALPDMTPIRPGQDAFVVPEANLEFEPQMTLAGILLTSPRIDSDNTLSPSYLKAILDSYAPENAVPLETMRASTAAQDAWQAKLNKSYRDDSMSAPIKPDVRPRIEESVEFQLEKKYRHPSLETVQGLELSRRSKTDFMSVNGAVPVFIRLSSIERAGRKLPPPYQMKQFPLPLGPFDVRTNFSVPEKHAEFVPVWESMNRKLRRARSVVDFAGIGTSRSPEPPSAAYYQWAQEPHAQTSKLPLIQSTYNGFLPPTGERGSASSRDFGHPSPGQHGAKARFDRFQTVPPIGPDRRRLPARRLRSSAPDGSKPQPSAGAAPTYFEP